jgi:hypothetical protein
MMLTLLRQARGEAIDRAAVSIVEAALAEEIDRNWVKQAMKLTLERYSSELSAELQNVFDKKAEDLHKRLDFEAARRAWTKARQGTRFRS